MLILALCAALLLQAVHPAAAQPAEQQITFSIGSDVADTDEALVREGIRFAQDYVAATLSPFPEETIIVNVRNTRDATGQATAFSGGEFIVIFTKSPGWRSLAPPERISILVHEYVHSWEFAALGDATEDVPTWLMEGVSQYFGYGAAVRAGLVRPQEVRDLHAWAVLSSDETPPLRDLETRDAFYQSHGAVYNLAYLAVAALMADSSPEDVDRFFHDVGSGTPWPGAFAANFGQDLDAFYASLEKARTELIGPREIPAAFAEFEPALGESAILLGALPDSVAIGQQVIILGRSDPGASCSIRLRSTVTSERLTRSTVTDGAGRLFWLITIPPALGPGPVSLSANCGGATARDDFTVSPEP